MAGVRDQFEQGGSQPVFLILGRLQHAAEQGERERAKLFEMLEHQGRDMVTVREMMSGVAGQLRELCGEKGRIAAVEATAAQAATDAGDWRKAKSRVGWIVGGVGFGGGAGGFSLSKFWERLFS